MTYTAAAILGLASQCAPNVAPQTVAAIVQTESQGYAIMRGAVQYPFREYVYRGVQLAFLYFAVTSLYGSQIGMPCRAASRLA